MRILVPLLALALLAVGCGHTNNLAKYNNVRGAKAYYRTFVSASAESHAHIDGMGDNFFAAVAAAIGSAGAADEAAKKLQRAVNGDTIALAVSHGIRDAAGDFLMITPVSSMSENPDLVIETELTEYKLVSSASGIHVHVKGNSRVIDQKSGGLVWEDSEDRSVPITSTWPAAIAPAPVAAGASIANAVQLMNLSEDQIREVISAAATRAGREIGETFREDVAKLHGGE